MSVVSVFHAVTQKIHDILVGLFGQKALDTVDSQVKQILSADFLPIFKEAIEAAGNLPGEDSAKRTAAFSQIASELTAQGKSLPTQLINFGIELVYGLVKAKSA